MARWIAVAVAVVGVFLIASSASDIARYVRITRM
jgi:hypothetical protein